MPGFEKSYIVDLPPQLGIRETRRVVGGYMLSGEDVLGCASFDDTIGVNGWPMESHVAGDVIFKFPPIPESRGFNELPYRMLVPEGIDNLLVAGRCASMTHDGQSAARVSGACFAMGEAAGTAAALALVRQYDAARYCGGQAAAAVESSKARLSGGIRRSPKGCRVIYAFGIWSRTHLSPCGPAGGEGARPPLPKRSWQCFSPAGSNSRLTEHGGNRMINTIAQPGRVPTFARLLLAGLLAMTASGHRRDRARPRR